MISLFPSRLFCLSLLALLIFSCSDEKPEPEETTTLPPTVEKKAEVVDTPSEPVPVVYIEELDQYQEYFKEQHETSFSHVTKKNWSSFTAGKDGILTKILLYGKPNYMISEHYGSSMSGFIRANNPDTGPKYGEWSISRDEIIDQLAVQGLTEIDRGWITLQMRGEIPQQKGRLYFIVCDKISDKRSWFGAFAFAEGNTYKKGRFWLHPEHDLVFRTYVGKTADQLDKEQKGEPLFDSATASLVPSNDIPKSPKPMIELSNNFLAAPNIKDDSPSQEVLSEQTDEPLYQPATQEIGQPKGNESLIEIIEEPQISEPVVTEEVTPDAVETTEPIEVIDPVEEEKAPQRSLFERFFKNKAE